MTVAMYILVMRKAASHARPGTQYFFGDRSAEGLGAISSGGIASNFNGVPIWRTVDMHVIVYVIEGHCDYEDERGAAARLGPGDLLHLFPGVRHTYPASKDERMVQYYANLTGPIFDLLHERGVLDEDTPVDHIEPVAYWLERLMSVLGDAPPATALEASERAAAMAHLLVEARMASQRASGGESDWLARAKAAIESHGLAGRPDWETIANALSISYEGFRKKFVGLAGEPPGQYRLRRLIEIAREMIVHNNPTNAEIAKALGFSDEFHFSRRFKQIAGMAATEFRRQIGWYGAGRAAHRGT